MLVASNLITNMGRNPTRRKWASGHAFV